MENKTIEVVRTGERHATPEQCPGLFADPIRVNVKLTERAMAHNHVPEGYEFECICYPHTPKAEFETVLPDGYHARTWDDSIDDKHAWMLFSVALGLDHQLTGEHRRGEVFPAAEQLKQREHEETAETRREYLAAHPNVEHEPMKATLTALEPLF